MIAACRDRLAELIHLPELSDAQTHDVEHQLAELSTDDPSVANDLRGDWNRRRHEWQTVFSIDPSSPNLATAFDTADLHVKADHLELSSTAARS